MNPLYIRGDDNKKEIAPDKFLKRIKLDISKLKFDNFTKKIVED
jgi:hypothetical protein